MLSICAATEISFLTSNENVNSFSNFYYEIQLN